MIPLLENTSLLSDETDKLGVTLFLQLLCAFLDEDNQNLFLLNNGIAIVGALMEEVIYDCYSNTISIYGYYFKEMQMCMLIFCFTKA